MANLDRYFELVTHRRPVAGAAAGGSSPKMPKRGELLDLVNIPDLSFEVVSLLAYSFRLGSATTVF